MRSAACEQVTHIPAHATIFRKKVPWILVRRVYLVSSCCLQGMCPKADDPVSVNQANREISVSVYTDIGSTIDGYVTFTFNG